MTARLFTVLAFYEGENEPKAVYSTSETMLRMIGRDHHRAAKIKPEMRLISPEHVTIDVMDIWATDWTDWPEAGA